MITEGINDALIEEMKAKVPPGMSLVNILMDILCMGKEAAYRRLRGEVPFTVAEAAVISRKLEISLDHLSRDITNPGLLYHLKNVSYGEYMDAYCSGLDKHINLYKDIEKKRHSKAEVSCLTIPHVFYHKYDYISKLRFYKWMYQHDYDSVRCSFDELEMPPEAEAKQRAFAEAGRNFMHSSYIMDDTMCMHPLTDIRYFSSMGLISSGSIGKIKTELLLMLDEMEAIARRGTFENGKEVNIYASNINVETSYSSIEIDDYILSAICIFGIHYITSRDRSELIRIKDWIQSQKKLSVLISGSGEMHRVRFFNKQREIVNSI